jgi:ATP-dependent DNA helicase RecG
MRSFGGGRELTPADLRGAPVHWPRPSVLAASIQALDGVGPKSAEAAEEAGLRTIGDVLRRLPIRHRDRQVRQLESMEQGDTGTVLVEVLGAKPRPFRRGRLTMVGVKVGDESGHVRATWFNQPWVAQKLERGAQFLLTGKLTDRGFTVSEWEFVAAAGDPGGVS